MCLPEGRVFVFKILTKGLPIYELWFFIKKLLNYVETLFYM